MYKFRLLYSHYVQTGVRQSQWWLCLLSFNVWYYSAMLWYDRLSSLSILRIVWQKVKSQSNREFSLSVCVFSAGLFYSLSVCCILCICSIIRVVAGKAKKNNNLLLIWFPIMNSAFHCLLNPSHLLYFYCHPNFPYLKFFFLFAIPKSFLLMQLIDKPCPLDQILSWFLLTLAYSQNNSCLSFWFIGTN